MYYDLKEIIDFWQEITGGTVEKTEHYYNVQKNNEEFYYSNIDSLKRDLLIDIEIISENKKAPEKAAAALDFLNYISCSEYSLNNDF